MCHSFEFHHFSFYNFKKNENWKVIFPFILVSPIYINNSIITMLEDKLD